MFKLLALKNQVWFGGILNAILVFDQLRTTWSTRDVSGLSLVMWIGFVYIQVVFAYAGYRAKQWGQFWGLGVSALISTTITILILAWR